MSTYPDRLGVFPLDGVVLFPHAHLPVRVDDSRHHALVKDALGRDGRLVLAPLCHREDRVVRAPVHTTACAGCIIRHQRLNDDVSDLIVRGERVVHLREVERWDPYRVARLDAEEPEQLRSKENARRRVKELRDLIERCCPGVFAKLERKLYHSPEEDGGLELLNTLASSLPVRMEKKLEWLRCDCPQARWEDLRETLLRMAEERDRNARVIVRYEDLRPPKPRSN
ncbi:LON peptidase substrate-binding domain-containing protein [bacterium]|nr:LON peptidase substrate-binding domain-containing protein [bacterium]